ncbi:SDR family NAD(P)-dependent oxidoreductase [Arthrobacter sp. NPDC056886]|uniref:SDR family NAD(P)-dependent oxidoreductase n=1 Tax=Arthrobacter sp. NPDC056886 TaxID=3345960 RepID=UPI00366F2D90
MSRLANKIAIVTGGGSGIGAGIVDEFRKQGAVTIAADITFSESTGTERYLDVTDESAWIRLVEDVTTEHGPLGILVNNAGTTGFQPLDELDRAEWDRIVNVNQLGTYLGIKACIPSMRKGGAGSIINVSSMFGSKAVPALAAYQASKAAVLGITRNAAITYAAEHIRANAILPGWIDTPMTASQDRRLNQRFVESTPMQRGGVPLDIAHAAVYLASDESNFVTGIELPIDGGYLAQ